MTTYVSWMDVDLVFGSLHHRRADASENNCHRTGRAVRIGLAPDWGPVQVQELAEKCGSQLERIKKGYSTRLVSLQENRGELSEDAMAALGEIGAAMHGMCTSKV